LPAGSGQSARTILNSADGDLNNSIAQRLKLTNATVGKWRVRFIERRIAGLYAAASLNTAGRPERPLAGAFH